MRSSRYSCLKSKSSLITVFRLTRSSVKAHAKDQGGVIKHEYNLIKGFSVEFPENHINTMEKHEHVKEVEKDQEISIS